MTERALTTALRCATAVLLAVVTPAWTVAAPAIILSLAAAMCMLHNPDLALHALHIIRDLLAPEPPRSVAEVPPIKDAASKDPADQAGRGGSD